MDILLGEREHWTVNYTGTQSYKTTLNSYSLVLRLWILIGWFKISVQAFQQMILIFINGNFVFHHWECTMIYRPLSYPLRSLMCQSEPLKKCAGIKDNYSNIILPEMPLEAR